MITVGWFVELEAWANAAVKAILAYAESCAILSTFFSPRSPICRNSNLQTTLLR